MLQTGGRAAGGGGGGRQRAPTIAGMMGGTKGATPFANDLPSLADDDEESSSSSSDADGNEAEVLQMESGSELPLEIIAAAHTWVHAKRVRAIWAVNQAATGSVQRQSLSPTVAFNSKDRVANNKVHKRWRAAVGAVTLTRNVQKEFIALRSVAAADRKRHEADRRSILVSTVRRIYGWARRRLNDEDGSVADCVKPLFAQIDADGSGEIDAHEFRLGLSAIGLQMDDRALSVLVEHMDADGNGILDMNEFCEQMTALLEAEAAAGSTILSKLCKVLQATGQTAAELFAEIDTDGSGELDATEWQIMLWERLGIRVQAAAADAAMKELDGGSTLEIAPLVGKLEDYQRKRRVFAGTVLSGVCEYIKSTNTSLVRLFARVDRDGSGDLDVVELQEALRKMDQDLSELEVEEITRELAPQTEQLSSRHFLDMLIQFEKEREVYTGKCRKLFDEVDADSSGHLDRNEVKVLAEKMGLGEQLANPPSRLTVDGLIADIEGTRRSNGDVEEEEGDGKVTYEELLPWFVTEGRSYLPPPVYPAVHELDEPTEAQLRELFESIDTDGSGEVNEEEVKEGTLARWPYVDSKLVSQAFEAADEDGSGHIAFHEFDELIRCLQFLNRQRHALEEAMTSFLHGGVGEDEFYVGLAGVGVVLTDSLASQYFKHECERLDVTKLTWSQFLTWVCRHECIDKSDLAAQQEEAAAERAQEDLEGRMTGFGDLYFDDLAHVVFTSHRGGYSREKQEEKVNKLKASSVEAIERVNALRAAINKAISQHDSFPQLPDQVIAKLIAGTTTDVYYTGQHIITQGRAEDTFFVIRRGMCEMLVDGESVGSLYAGDTVGEMALMYGTRRSMTVRASGPCEVFSLNRATYETAISILPVDQRQSGLVKMMELFWLLVSGPDGSNRSEVDYSAYLKYHLRVSKTLTDAAEEAEYDEDEQREMALEDWEEDTKRFGLKTTGTITMPMFFDSLYQMVDLWSGDLDVSYQGFLRLVFYNIAEWIEQDDARNEHAVAHWKFKGLDDVLPQGEKLDAMQEAAKAKQEAAAKAKKEAADAAEALRLEIERQEAAHKKRLEDEAKARKAKREREELLAKLAQVKRQVALAVASGLLSADQAAEERERLMQRGNDSGDAGDGSDSTDDGTHDGNAQTLPLPGRMPSPDHPQFITTRRRVKLPGIGVTVAIALLEPNDDFEAQQQQRRRRQQQQQPGWSKTLAAAPALPADAASPRTGATTPRSKRRSGGGTAHSPCWRLAGSTDATAPASGIGLQQQPSASPRPMTDGGGGLWPKPPQALYRVSHYSCGQYARQPRELGKLSMSMSQSLYESSRASTIGSIERGGGGGGGGGSARGTISFKSGRSPRYEHMALYHPTAHSSQHQQHPLAPLLSSSGGRIRRAQDVGMVRRSTEFQRRG